MLLLENVSKIVGPVLAALSVNGLTYMNILDTNCHYKIAWVHIPAGACEEVASDLGLTELF